MILDNEVHLWVVDVGQRIDQSDYYHGLLDNEEKKKASQFVFDYLKNRFTVCRGILKSLLGMYLSIDTAKVALAYGHYGKPNLVDSTQMIEFNLSHSENMAIFGFGKKISLGVDIEYISSKKEQTYPVEELLSSKEIQRFQNLQKKERNMAFFEAWTCKEAILKALGMGFYMSPKEIEMTFSPESEPKVLRIGNLKKNNIASWKLESIRWNQEYQIALAADCSYQLRVFNDYEFDCIISKQGINAF